MKRSLFIIALIAVSLSLIIKVYAQSEKDFKILTAEVISISEHPGAAYTIEIKNKTSRGEKNDALTIDPRCTFYKDDKKPKTIDIVKLGDKIEATYITHKGIKVAFNIIVMPK